MRGYWHKIANAMRLRSVLHFLIAVALCGLAARTWADFPPLCVEIGPEHPLFIFQDTGEGCPDASSYAQQIMQVWTALPEDLRPYSVIQIEGRGADVPSREQWFRALLTPLQAADIPVVVRVADADLRRIYPVEDAETLVHDFTCIKGLQAVNLPFEEYYEFGMDDPMGMPPAVRWLIGTLDVAARYGRFLSLELDRIRWPRVMSNAWCRPLMQKFRECHGYLVPVASCRGPHVVTQMSALMGLWIEGTAAQWGVGPQSNWYSDAHFIEPGVYGLSEEPAKMPSSLYRAMIFDGAMAGAAVYSFAPDKDLWFGTSRRHWDEAICPTLREVLDLGLIARKDFVKKKARVAYQLAPSRTSEDFHFNLRDIDGVLDSGFLIKGAYGMERPGQVPELILNTGRHYWVPLLPAPANEAAPGGFEAVIKPGIQTSEETWRTLLDRYAQADGEGSAFICNIARGIFVMNTCENSYETQTFRLPAVPAAVRGFQAQRQDTGITITWPFREGDLSYKIYKRVLPSTQRMLLAKNVDERKYTDTTAAPDQTIAYAVTALTDDKEPYEGVVEYGAYLALSNVESRVAEEVTIGPLLGLAQSAALDPVPGPPPNAVAPWPNLAALTEAQAVPAGEIARRIEEWDRAFSSKDLNGVLGLYATDYEDAQRWRFEYMRRAYQWFFEHYNACAMHRQIRQWNFSTYEATGVVGVLLYCRFAGNALTDPTGRVADLPAWFPLGGNSEAWIYFIKKDDTWRILRTDPAVPSFKDILSFSASPYDHLPVGPDS